MGFKMKKPSITQGTAAHKKAIKDYQELQLNREMEQNMPDGRSMSSPFQKNEGKYKEIGGKARPPKAVEEKAIKLSDQKKARMEKEWKDAGGGRPHKETGSPAKKMGIYSVDDEGNRTRISYDEATGEDAPSRQEWTGPDNLRHPTVKKYPAEKGTEADRLIRKEHKRKTLEDKETGETITRAEDIKRQKEIDKKDTSPAKKTEGKSKKQKVAEMHKKHKGKPGWQEHVDKTFGGETTFKDGVSTTRRPKLKREGASPNKFIKKKHLTKGAKTVKKGAKYVFNTGRLIGGAIRGGAKGLLSKGSGTASFTSSGYPMRDTIEGAQEGIEKTKKSIATQKRREKKRK